MSAGGESSGAGQAGGKPIVGAAESASRGSRGAVDLKAVLGEVSGLVDNRLGELLKSPDPQCASIYEAMFYSLMAGGKRFRPALVLLTSRMLGAADDVALPAACAIEMVHTYSLIHDDLPAMDNDDLRRGRPTSHKVFGEAMAILAGDALLTEAFVVLSTRVADGQRSAALVRELSTAAGACGMVGGQVLDLESEGREGRDWPVESIHRRKTGQLILAAVRLGAVSAGADEGTLDRLSEYGRQVGLAFQIADDVLDARGTAESLGKTAGKDAASGKRTYVSVYGLEESERRADAALAAAIEALEPFGAAAEPLRALARFCVERKS